MTIKVRCPECTKLYTLNDDALGKKFRCKERGEVIRIPERSRQKSRQNSASRSGTTQTRRKKVVKRRRRPAPVEDYDDYGSSNDDYGSDYDDDYGDDYRRPARRAPARSRKRKKRRKSAFIPDWVNKKSMLITGGIVGGLLLVSAIISVISPVAAMVIAFGIWCFGTFVGLGILIGASIWGIVIAFEEDTSCGIMYLFLPFYSLVYLITRWDSMWPTLALTGIGIAVMTLGSVASSVWATVFGFFFGQVILF